MPDTETKKCPFCGEMIRIEAVKCRFCGEFLEKPSEGDSSTVTPSVQTPVGYASGIDTQTLYAGPVSHFVLFWPTCVTLFWFAIAGLIALKGSLLVERLGQGYERVPLIASASVAFLALLYWLYKWLDFRSAVYRITNDRVEYEHGLFSKSIVNVDVWRIEDMAFNQSLLHRILGIGRIDIVSSDQDTPKFSIGPISKPRDLYDKLKKTTLEADRRRGVVHFEK